MPLLDGQALLDPDGKWLYLLNDRGLWAFGLPEMTFSSVMPWFGNVPATLSISPDGNISTSSARRHSLPLRRTNFETLGLSSLTDLPTAGVKYSVFASPTEGSDGSAFAPAPSAGRSPIRMACCSRATAGKRGAQPGAQFSPPLPVSMRSRCRRPSPDGTAVCVRHPHRDALSIDGWRRAMGSMGAASCTRRRSTGRHRLHGDAGRHGSATDHR